MSEELMVMDSADISIRRDPIIILEEAKKAAKALKDVVSMKSKPVIFNGEQYLEFEDLQTLGRFYGVSSKVISTSFIEYGSIQGFEARSVAIRNADGVEVSAAEAMCLNDENNWKNKPLFQLRSMAQTRACAKALRNVLAWVVVLAGYRPTPAEEMQEVKNREPLKEPQKKANGEVKPQEPTEVQVLVKDVTLKTGKGDKGEWTLYKIITADDLTYQTFNKDFGEIAVKEKSTGMPIIIEFKPVEFKGKDGKTIQGKEIVSLTRSGALPAEKDEIPF